MGNLKRCERKVLRKLKEYLSSNSHHQKRPEITSEEKNEKRLVSAEDALKIFCHNQVNIEEA